MKICVWFTTPNDKFDRFPMVMIEKEDSKKYHYGVTRSSLNRLVNYIASKNKQRDGFIIPDGWVVRL